MIDHFPKRIVCLTEETTELLYMLGEEHRIAGISGFTMRPLRARKEKPKVSAFLDADIDKIIALQPDLVIGYSDIQANIAQSLIARGVSVLINNHHSVEEIFRFIVQLGALVGKPEEAFRIAESYRADLINAIDPQNSPTGKIKVYFEEWCDPLIFCSQWVSELIQYGGGTDIYAHLQPAPLGKQRIIAEPDDVIRRNPDVIIASWCGKKFKKDKLISRPGWSEIEAVKHDRIHEIKSEKILQPGPAALTAGFEEIRSILALYSNLHDC